MTLEKLKAHLKVSDFEFSYNNVWYFICPVNVFEPFTAGEVNKNAKTYETFDDLVNSFIIEGKPLKDVIHDIDW